jgi:hypothetical protein
MSTIMMHRYQSTLLKWTILGNDMGKWKTTDNLQFSYWFVQTGSDIYSPFSLVRQFQ